MGCLKSIYKLVSAFSFTCKNISWICRLFYNRSAASDDLIELREVVGIIFISFLKCFSP